MAEEQNEPAIEQQAETDVKGAEAAVQTTASVVVKSTASVFEKIGAAIEHDATEVEEALGIGRIRRLEMAVGFLAAHALQPAAADSFFNAFPSYRPK